MKLGPKYLNFVKKFGCSRNSGPSFMPVMNMTWTPTPQYLTALNKFTFFAVSSYIHINLKKVCHTYAFYSYCVSVHFIFNLYSCQWSLISNLLPLWQQIRLCYLQAQGDGEDWWERHRNDLRPVRSARVWKMWKDPSRGYNWKTMNLVSVTKEMSHNTMILLIHFVK